MQPLMSNFHKLSRNSSKASEKSDAESYKSSKKDSHREDVSRETLSMPQGSIIQSPDRKTRLSVKIKLDKEF